MDTDQYQHAPAAHAGIAYLPLAADYFLFLPYYEFFRVLIFLG